MFHYIVRSTDPQRSLTDLRELHDWVIKPQLRQVRGVAEVNSWGGFEKQYVEQHRAAAFGAMQQQYQGNDLIDIRTWTLPQGAQEKVPTSKGISINIKLYPQLKEAIDLLGKELKDNNLI